MNEIEFKTFKAISRPGRKIPGFSDEEIMFLLFYYIFIIVFTVVVLGFIPNMFNIKIPDSFVSTFSKVFFLLLPSIVFLIIKTSQIGKQDGYVFQKFYTWMFSSLGYDFDTRNYDDRKLIAKFNDNWLGFLKNKITYKKSKNPLLHNYCIKWDPKEEEKKIEMEYQKTLIMYENFLQNKRKKEQKTKNEFNFDIEFNFWYGFYKRKLRNLND